MALQSDNNESMGKYNIISGFPIAEMTYPGYLLAMSAREMALRQTLEWSYRQINDPALGEKYIITTHIHSLACISSMKKKGLQRGTRKNWRHRNAQGMRHSEVHLGMLVGPCPGPCEPANEHVVCSTQGGETKRQIQTDRVKVSY